MKRRKKFYDKQQIIFVKFAYGYEDFTKIFGLPLFASYCVNDFGKPALPLNH